MLAAVAEVSFDEDGDTSITLSGSDVDGDALTYNISGGTEITATVEGSTVTFDSADDFNGSEDFTATVSDGALSHSQSFLSLIHI